MPERHTLEPLKTKAKTMTNLKFIVRSEHASPAYALNSAVTVSEDSEGYYLDLPGFGCGKSFSTPEQAIESLLRENGCFNIDYKPLFEEGVTFASFLKPPQSFDTKSGFVIRSIRNEFVVHEYSQPVNEHTAPDYYNGSYCESLQSAYQEFNRRVTRWIETYSNEEG